MASSSKNLSVYVPNYNDAKYLEKALKSICEQTPTPMEVVVLEDCSTDNSREILDVLEKKYPCLRSIRYPEKSPDWNKAFLEHFKNAKGDYLLGVSANDIVYPGFFAAFDEALRQHPDAGMFFSDYYAIDENDGVIKSNKSGFQKIQYMKGESYDKYLSRFHWFESGCAGIIRKDVLLWLLECEQKKLGPWLDSVGFAVAGLKYGACYLADIYGGFRSGPNQYCNTAMYKTPDPFHFCDMTREFLDHPEIKPHVTPVSRACIHSRSLFTMQGTARDERYLKELLPHAVTLIQAGRYDLAEVIYQQILPFFQQRADLFCDWGFCLCQLGRNADAEKVFRHVTQLDPNNANAYTNLGVCLQSRGALPEALEAHQKAVALDPNFAGRQLNLGHSLAALGRQQEALQAYQRAHQLDGASADIKNCLVEFLKGMGRTQDAHAVMGVAPGQPTDVNALANAARPGRPVSSQ